MHVRSRWLGLSLVIALFISLLLPAGQPAVAATVTIDPLLTQKLNAALPTDSLQAILTYDHKPTTLDLTAATGLGLLTQRFETLPMLGVMGTPAQLRAATKLGGLRSVFYNKSLQYLLHESVPLIGADRVWNDLGYTGRNVGVAIIDSGIDGLHPDLPYGSAVVQNVKILGPNLFTGGAVIAENLPTSDTTSGHGTHVAGTIAGRGTASNGYFRGVAPDSKLIGVSAGDAISILFALEGFDYVLAHRQQYNIRVVSNSWGTSGGTFDATDPINVASKQAHDAGIAVTFAAGNDGPGNNTRNPYSVIGVAAGNKDGATLADFSSRGIPGDSTYHPTITAPGAGIVSTRAPNTVLPPLGAPDDANIDPAWIPYYTTMSGTSMATPHVSGVLALLLEAKPSLTPDQLKTILVQTAKPMPGYAQFEVGAGYIDAFAAANLALTY